MPRKRTSPKERRSWSFRDLSPADVQSIVMGWPPPEGCASDFRSIEDVRAAWEALKQHFLTMQSWNGDQGEDLLAAHRPGERPWAWWVFDRDREMPRDQPRVLRKLGLLTTAEEAAMRVWDVEARKIGYKGLRDFYSVGKEEDS